MSNVAVSGHFVFIDEAMKASEMAGVGERRIGRQREGKLIVKSPAKFESEAPGAAGMTTSQRPFVRCLVRYAARENVAVRVSMVTRANGSQSASLRRRLGGFAHLRLAHFM